MQPLHKKPQAALQTIINRLKQEGSQKRLPSMIMCGN